MMVENLEMLRAPSKDVGKSTLSPSILFPILVVFASGDAASGILDPSLPQLIAAAAVSSLALGVTLNSLVLPELTKLPQKTVDITSIRHQLENKIYAVGEPSYRARRNRVKRVREGLENSLKNRIELIESYARISSMIEIEVELELDVVAAEAVNNAENIAQQIEQIMEIENLEEKWRIQAEANDEAERLLSSDPVISEQLSDS